MPRHSRGLTGSGRGGTLSPPGVTVAADVTTASQEHPTAAEPGNARCGTLGRNRQFFACFSLLASFSKSREAYVSCGFDSHLRHQPSLACGLLTILLGELRLASHPTGEGCPPKRGEDQDAVRSLATGDTAGKPPDRRRLVPRRSGASSAVPAQPREGGQNLRAGAWPGRRFLQSGTSPLTAHSESDGHDMAARAQQRTLTAPRLQSSRSQPAISRAPMRTRGPCLSSSSPTASVAARHMTPTPGRPAGLSDQRLRHRHLEPVQDQFDPRAPGEDHGAGGPSAFQMSIAIRHAPSSSRRRTKRLLPHSVNGAADPRTVKVIT